MEIAQEIKACTETGVRRLIAEYGDRLYDVAFRLCQNDADAQELVSRTLARAIERIDLFGGRSTFYTWLYSILANFWRMDLRKRKSDMVEFTDELPDHPDDQPDPLEALAVSAEASEVRMAVGSLPENYRAVTVLRYFEDMTVPEIAHILAIPEGTVKFRLHKAKKLMRRRLSQTVDVPLASQEERKR